MPFELEIIGRLKTRTTTVRSKLCIGGKRRSRRVFMVQLYVLVILGGFHNSNVEFTNYGFLFNQLIFWDLYLNICTHNNERKNKPFNNLIFLKLNWYATLELRLYSFDISFFLVVSASTYEMRHLTTESDEVNRNALYFSLHSWSDLV